MKYFNTITVYKNICFGCVKEHLRGNVSFTHPKHVFDRKKSNNFLGGIYVYVYLLVNLTTDNSK